MAGKVIDLLREATGVTEELDCCTSITLIFLVMIRSCLFGISTSPYVICFRLRLAWFGEFQQFFIIGVCSCL